MSRGHVRQQVGDCVRCGVSTAALQSEVEVLRRRLLDRDVAIVQLEAQMAQDRPDHYPQPQVAVLRAQCDHWQDRYDRLLEAHKRLQKVNQGLEDKLLRLVDRTESEKSSLAADTASLTTALTTAAQAINRLKQENDRYKNDLNLAIQLLQCNPSKYATHKLHTLPSDLQKKAKTRLTRGEVRDNPRPEMKIIKVPIPTFPPTAMVYSVNKVQEETVKEEPVDAVSAAIMAAVLEERERERAGRHCPTCSCTTQPKDHPTRHTDDGDVNGNGFSSSQLEERLKGDGSKGHEMREDGLYESKGDGMREGRPWGDIPKGTVYAGGDGLKCEESKGSRVDGRLEGKDGWKGIVGDGQKGSNFLDEELRDEGVSFRVNVVDVGTQVLPSYIGETGKVQSTCIYCHSTKTSSTERLQSSQGKSTGFTLHSRSKSQPVNQVSVKVGQGQGGIGQGDRIGMSQDTSVRPPDPTSPTSRSSFAFGTHSSWDWAAGAGGGDDSPSTPSTTPSSLVSASLSYESETSNGTSPQDSPLRPPLLSAPRQNHLRSLQQNSDISRQTADLSRQTDIQKQVANNPKHTADYKQAVDPQKETVHTHSYSDDLQGTDIYRQGSDTHKQTTDFNDQSSGTCKYGTYNQRHSENHKQATETHRQTADFHRQIIDTQKQNADTHKQNTGIYRHTDTSSKYCSDSRNNHNPTYSNTRIPAESKYNSSIGSGTARQHSGPHSDVMESSSNSPQINHFLNSHSNHFINSHSSKHHLTHSSSGIQVKLSGGTHNSYHAGSYKIAFNARSPHHDVFTPPIHRSPTSNRSPNSNPSKSWSSLSNSSPSVTRSWSPEAVVASSTTTASSTETTL